MKMTSSQTRWLAQESTRTVLRRVSGTAAVVAVLAAAIGVPVMSPQPDAGTNPVLAIARADCPPDCGGGPGNGGTPTGPPGGGTEFVPPSIPAMPSYDPGRGQPPLDQNNGISIYNSAAPQPSQAAQPSQAPVQNQDGSYSRAANGEQQPINYNNAPNNQQLNNNWQKLSDQLNQQQAQSQQPSRDNGQDKVSDRSNAEEKSNDSRQSQCQAIKDQISQTTGLGGTESIDGPGGASEAQQRIDKFTEEYTKALIQNGLSGECGDDSAASLKDCIPVEGKGFNYINTYPSKPFITAIGDSKGSARLPVKVSIWYDLGDGRIHITANGKSDFESGGLVELNSMANMLNGPISNTPGEFVPELQVLPKDVFDVVLSVVGTVNGSPVTGTMPLVGLEICDRTQDGKFISMDNVRNQYGVSEEAKGIAQYRATHNNVFVNTVKKLASLDTYPEDPENLAKTRYFDGLALKPDGTYEGIEVKSGKARKSRQQRDFDDAINSGSTFAWFRMSPGGPRLKITSVADVNV